MIIDRAFLENIMNNTPYGTGQKFIREAKGKKMHTYTVRPYTIVYEPPVVIEVFAKDNEAYTEARAQYKAVHNRSPEKAEWYKVR